jgi:hypothetical protein
MVAVFLKFVFSSPATAITTYGSEYPAHPLDEINYNLPTNAKNEGERNERK